MPLKASTFIAGNISIQIYLRTRESLWLEWEILAQTLLWRPAIWRKRYHSWCYWVKSFILRCRQMVFDTVINVKGIKCLTHTQQITKEFNFYWMFTNFSMNHSCHLCSKTNFSDSFLLFFFFFHHFPSHPTRATGHIFSLLSPIGQNILPTFSCYYLPFAPSSPY